MPSESQIIERIHLVDRQQQVDSSRIDTLENSTDILWVDLKDMGKMVSNIRVDVAKILVVSTIAQTALTGAIVYFFTKGG